MFNTDEEMAEYDASWNYHYDCIIKEMFEAQRLSGIRISYSVQELDALVKQRMGE